MARRTRKKGTGSVRFRKDIKRWCLDYCDKQHVRHQITTTCATREEALEELERKRALICLGMDQPTEGEKRKISPLFKDYADEWYGRREVDGLARSTLRSYQGILKNHLKPYFGSMEMGAITRVDIKNFAAKKKGGEWDRKTLRHVLGILSQILNEAEDDGVIPISPYPKTRLLGRAVREVSEDNGNGKMKCLELHEIPIFLNACPEGWYPLFYTFIFAGLRRGEALGLKWGDVDLEGQQINVKRSLYKGEEKATKTEASERSIDIGPRHVEILKQHRAKRIETLLKIGKQLTDDDFVFSQADGRPLDPDNLYKRIFRPILKRTGLRCDIHGLRHTFASLLIASKKHNLKYIQDQLGHANISMTMDTYGHLLEVGHRGAGKATEDWFKEELAKERKRLAIGDNK